MIQDIAVPTDLSERLRDAFVEAGAGQRGDSAASIPSWLIDIRGCSKVMSGDLVAADPASLHGRSESVTSPDSTTTAGLERINVR